jgi:hypothetical protein
MTVIDEHTRECLAIDVAGSIRSGRVIEVLSCGWDRPPTGARTPGEALAAVLGTHAATVGPRV